MMWSGGTTFDVRYGGECHASADRVALKISSRYRKDRNLIA